MQHRFINEELFKAMITVSCAIRLNGLKRLQRTVQGHFRGCLLIFVELSKYIDDFLNNIQNLYPTGIFGQYKIYN
jgi:hypothetical protein